MQDSDKVSNEIRNNETNPAKPDGRTETNNIYKPDANLPKTGRIKSSALPKMQDIDDTTGKTLADGINDHSAGQHAAYGRKQPDSPEINRENHNLLESANKNEDNRSNDNYDSNNKISGNAKREKYITPNNHTAVGENKKEDITEKKRNPKLVNTWSSKTNYKSATTETATSVVCLFPPKSNDEGANTARQENSPFQDSQANQSKHSGMDSSHISPSEEFNNGNDSLQKILKLTTAADDPHNSTPSLNISALYSKDIQRTNENRTLGNEIRYIKNQPNFSVYLNQSRRISKSQENIFARTFDKVECKKCIELVYYWEKTLKLQNDIVGLNEIIENYKREITQAKKENETVNRSLSSLYAEVEDNKKSSYFAPLWNIINWKKNSEETKVDNQFEHISAYLRTLHENTIKQEKSIKHKSEENKHLEQRNSELKAELATAKSENIDLNKKFEQKSTKQINIVKERDEELKRIKGEQARIITECNSVLTKQRKQYENEITKMQQDLEALFLINKKLETEKHEMKQRTLMEQKKLTNSLEQQQQNVKVITKERNMIKTQLNEEIHLKSQLHLTLVRLKNNLTVQETFLIQEKEKIRGKLNNMSNIIAHYNEKISSEDIRNKTENKIITQALEKISLIKSDAEKYGYQIDTFQGNHEDKTYLHIKEMLLRAIEKLDGIESQKKEVIQSKRRETIIYVKHLQDQLERRVNSKKSVYV